jgi:hypothetical protein
LFFIFRSVHESNPTVRSTADEKGRRNLCVFPAQNDIEQALSNCRLDHVKQTPAIHALQDSVGTSSDRTLKRLIGSFRQQPFGT